MVMRSADAHEAAYYAAVPTCAMATSPQANSKAAIVQPIPRRRDADVRVEYMRSPLRARASASGSSRRARPGACSDVGKS